VGDSPTHYVVSLCYSCDYTYHYNFCFNWPKGIADCVLDCATSLNGVDPNL